MSTIRSIVIYCTIFSLVLHPATVLAQTGGSDAGGPDARVYLTDGSVVMGKLLERSEDLIILQVREEVFTFDPQTEVERIVTLNSLGTKAKTTTVTDFPYISFLGGTVAFALLSALQFDTASDRDKEADVNKANLLLPRAKKLRDKADRARLWGWSSALLAAGTLGVALIPRKRTQRVFPDLTLRTSVSGEPLVHLALRTEF